MREVWSRPRIVSQSRGESWRRSASFWKAICSRTKAMISKRLKEVESNRRRLPFRNPLPSISPTIPANRLASSRTSSLTGTRASDPAMEGKFITASSSCRSGACERTTLCASFRPRSFICRGVMGCEEEWRLSLNCWRELAREG